jgi:MSHA biogenesis protein MshJ
MKERIRERLNEYAGKVDAMSLRERLLIFAAIAFALVSMINALFLEPLLAQQKHYSSMVGQQQEKMKETQAQLNEMLTARQVNKFSPQREHIRQLREQIAKGDSFLNNTRDKLVPPAKMAHLLEEVLGSNSRLQLVTLNTLPVTPFTEPGTDATKSPSGQERQIFKHGVQITVRGSYADLLQYLAALEKMPTQMFWGMAKMNVVQFPSSELTLTLYTLSLDKTWLQV